MSALQDPNFRHLRARVAAAVRDHRDAPETEALRAELRAVAVTAKITALLESAPPLTVEQRDRLAAILSGAAA